MYADREKLKEEFSKLTDKELETKLEETMGRMVMAMIQEPQKSEDYYKISDVFAAIGGLIEVAAERKI